MDCLIRLRGSEGRQLGLGDFLVGEDQAAGQEPDTLRGFRGKPGAAPRPHITLQWSRGGARIGIGSNGHLITEQSYVAPKAGLVATSLIVSSAALSDEPKITVLYSHYQPQNSEEFDKYYYAKHIPMVYSV